MSRFKGKKRKVILTFTQELKIKILGGEFSPKYGFGFIFIIKKTKFDPIAPLDL